MERKIWQRRPRTVEELESYIRPERDNIPLSKISMQRSEIATKFKVSCCLLSTSNMSNLKHLICFIYSPILWLKLRFMTFKNHCIIAFCYLHFTQYPTFLELGLFALACAKVHLDWTQISWCLVVQVGTFVCIKLNTSHLTISSHQVANYS